MKNYNTVKQYFETKLINHPTTDCKLSLNLGNVAITETYEDESYIGFTGRSAGAECHCKRCGQVITNLKQYKTTYTILAKINSKNVVLKLRKKMYHCPDCDSSTVEQLLDVSGKNQKSNSFIQSMLRCLLIKLFLRKPKLIDPKCEIFL
jgi:transposase